MNPIKLGIIELGDREVNAINAIEEIIEYAIEVEQAGFTKFWLAEHHYFHTKNHPYTSPDILISIIASVTEKIKLGSAGTCISTHSPYSVVTNYKFLNNLFRNRITLGLSKGTPDSACAMQLFNKEITKENRHTYFKENLNTIVDLLENEEENLKTKSILIPPFGGLKPDLWYLSCSFQNLPDALQYKLNYCVSIFHNYGQDINNLNFNKAEIIGFKTLFKKQHGYCPEVAISLAIIIKDTLEEAEEIWETIQKEKGSKEGFIIIPTTLDLLEERLTSYQEQFGIDEFILYDLANNNEEKIRNIHSISERFHLSPIPV